MASIRTTPCNWPLAHCGEPGTGEAVCSSLGGLAPAMQTLITEMATAYLWNWTRQQFGTCPVTIRPCRTECGSGGSTYRGRGGTGTLPWTEGTPGPLNPTLFNGQWYNLGCGGGCSNDPCSCSYVPEVDLMGPVASIDQVRIGGVALLASQYRVDNYRYLVRTDGGTWPVCQNMLQNPATLDTNTFEVTYQIGVTVPAGGQVAAGVLACELAKAACGNNTCKLPQRIQQLTRQQVSMTVLDSYGTLYEKGTTGLWIVDSWVASVNAPVAKSGYRIASPDRRTTRRTTG